VRAFFALWPDAAARDAVATLAREVAAETGGRAPVAENIHLTLAFLGDVPRVRIAVLQAMGAAAAGMVPAFELSLDRVGTFRGSGIAWIGASDVPTDLARLVAELNAALSGEGFAIDSRAFQAHVTLARRCRKGSRVAIVTPIAWPVTRLVLNASDLGSGGPRYRELGGWRFGKPPANAHQA
jgi:2'-5' RNA ligase